MWPQNLSSPKRKQTDIVLCTCTMNSQRQDSWTSIKKWLCYSDHRVALVVHRAQKSVPDSAGEWPTFLPPPLESCSGTANVDGPNCTHNEHELDPNLCVFIAHYDISKPACGHWIYPLQIESKQTCFMCHEQSKAGLDSYSTVKPQI